MACLLQRKEIALRLYGRRLIRVNVPPVPAAPGGNMPWIDGPNWNAQQGRGSWTI